MNRENNIKRFEELMGTIDRSGIDGLMNYIQKSDFYTAPASTKFHLSCPGGLLQHSLDVCDALFERMEYDPDQDKYLYKVAGKTVCVFRPHTLILTSLLHDICKTHFYAIEMRNQKVYKPTGSKRDSGGRFDWDQVPVYTVNDQNPYGHGEKSVMMIEEFMKLTMEERYAIRWHMGLSDCSFAEAQAFNAACEKYPLVLILHTADQEASHFMEDNDDVKEQYRVTYAPGGFQEAEPI